MFSMLIFEILTYYLSADFSSWFRLKGKSRKTFDIYRGADKSLAQPGRKQVTATEDFDFHISYL
jgi:hypothetical protein